MNRPHARRSKASADRNDGFRVRGAAFELRKRGVARFDLRDPYHLALTLSWPAFLASVLLLVLVINTVFASLYMSRPGDVANLRNGDFADAFFFSLETLATVGYGEMAPATVYGHSVAAIEIISGMAFTAILTGLFFVRFSRPKACILFADTAVVATHDGTPTLMIRVANSRLTMLTNAAASLGVILEHQSQEGHVFQRISNLPLTRQGLAVFPLTWTLMHPIDAASPLHGMTSESMVTQDVRLFLTVAARDPALGVEVQDIRDYAPTKIAFGMRYADAVDRDAQGRTIADLRRLNLIEPELGSSRGNVP